MRFHRFLAVLAFVALPASRPAYADPSAAYFMPQLHAGDRITTLATRTVSFIGVGFPPSLQRYSGSGTTHILSVTRGNIRMHARWHTDGSNMGEDIENVDVGTRERVVDGVLRPDLGANGFTPGNLFGRPPSEIVVGTQWNAALLKPASLAPATQTVRVIALASQSGTITLARTGEFTGSLGMDKRGAPITVKGASVQARVVARGPARWTGYTTLIHGLTFADALLIERDVDLVTPDGTIYHARERVMSSQNIVSFR